MKRINKGVLYVASCVAASLMFGVLLAAWLRTLDAVAGRTLYSLCACLGSVAVGLLAGYSAASWPSRRVREPAAVLSVSLMLLGLWMVVQLCSLVGIAGGWQRILTDFSRSFLQFGVALGKTSALFFLVPSLLAGGAVRAALEGRLRVSAERPAASGAPVLLLALLPACAGYMVSAAVLVPAAGVEPLIRWGALWFGVLASLVILRSFWSVVPAAVVIAVVFTSPLRTQTSILANGVFSRLVHRDSGFAQGMPSYTKLTRQHTVAVFDDHDYQFVFAVDGRPLLFGNRFHTARTLAGYVPLLVRPGSRKAVVWGPEAGLYVPFFVRGGVGDVAYGDADSEVAKLAFATDGHVTGDDVSVRKAVREVGSLSSREAYDVVFLAPEPVWMRGTCGAYSSSLFKRCREALSEEGIAVLHLDARALSARRFASVARAFSGVFPDMQVWNTGCYDWLLVGEKKARQVSADGMLGLFERTAVVRDLARANILSLAEVLSCRVCDAAGLSVWLDSAEPEAAWQTAWRAPRAAFGGSDALLRPITLEACRQRTLGWVLPGTLEEEVFLAIRSKTEQNMNARSSAATALSENARGRGDTGLAAARAAAKINPRDVLLLNLCETLELEGRRRIAIGDFKGALKCYENLLSFSPGTARAYYGLGYCLRAKGDNETSYLNFARAVAAAPEQIGYRMELAQVAVTVGEYREADRQFQEVLKREPANAEALFRYAKALAVKERADKDLPKAVKLAERACVLTAWKNSEYAFGLADLYLDAGRVMEGMGLKRRLKEIGKAKTEAAP